MGGTFLPASVAVGVTVFPPGVEVAVVTMSAGRRCSEDVAVLLLELAATWGGIGWVVTGVSATGFTFAVGEVVGALFLPLASAGVEGRVGASPTGLVDVEGGDVSVVATPLRGDVGMAVCGRCTV